MDPNKLCESLKKGLPNLFECTSVPGKGLRVRTPLMYPDGGIVDIFIRESGDHFKLTDFGETLDWLWMHSVSSRRSPKQNRMVEDICQTLGVELCNGELVLMPNSKELVGDEILRLAQAVVSVSDLWFTLRTRATATMADEVGEWLAEKEISFDRTVSEFGRSGEKWTIDYRIVTPSATSLVFLLSTDSKTAARRMAEHILAGCVDLSHLGGKPKSSFVSLFDDSEDLWQEKEIRLVEQYSEIAYWSRRDEFEQVLRAGP